MNPITESHPLMKLVRQAQDIGSMIAPAQPDRQCQGMATNKRGETYRCQHVGTVEIKGTRYCLTCARKVTEAAK